MKYLKFVIPLLFATVVGVFISAPQIYIQSFLDGLTVWAFNVLPVLFPFAVLATLTVKFLPNFRRSPSRLLFGMRADGTYLCSLVCGYPIGAKMISESNLNCDAATQACSFCSSASPLFVIISVGVKMLQNGKAAAVLFVSHVLSTAINGILYRKKQDVSVDNYTTFVAADLGNAVTGAMLSVLSVGGLIALFYMLGDIVRNLLPSALSQSVAVNFLLGLLEMTNGTVALCQTCDVLTATVLCSFLLAFGGVCVFCQSMTFLAKKNVAAGKFLTMKLMQASIATVLSFVLGRIFLR